MDQNQDLVMNKDLWDANDAKRIDIRIQTQCMKDQDREDNIGEMKMKCVKKRRRCYWNCFNTALFVCACADKSVGSHTVLICNIYCQLSIITPRQRWCKMQSTFSIPAYKLWNKSFSLHQTVKKRCCCECVTFALWRGKMLIACHYL